MNGQNPNNDTNNLGGITLGGATPVAPATPDLNVAPAPAAPAVPATPDLNVAPAPTAPVTPDLNVAPAPAAPVTPDLNGAPVPAAPVTPDLNVAPVPGVPATPDLNVAPAPTGINNGMQPTSIDDLGTPQTNIFDPNQGVGGDINAFGSAQLDPFLPTGTGVEQSLGQIPPEAPKKKGMNKTIFTLLILALIAGVAYGVYYYLNMGSNEATATVATKALKYGIGDNIPTSISEYATFTGIDAGTCSLNNDEIDSTTAGMYEYTITCDGKTFKGTVEIVDMALPEITTKDVNVVVGDSITAEDFIVSCSKDACVYEFVDQTKVDALLADGGSEMIEIKITDNAGNEVVEEVMLTVTTTEVSAYLEATSEEMTLDDYAASYVIVDSFAMDDTNTLMGISKRTYEYTFTDETEFESVMEEYKDSDNFNDITGQLVFDEEMSMLTVTVTLTSETLDLEFGDTFPTTYSEVKAYYTGNDYTVKPVSAE